MFNTFSTRRKIIREIRKSRNQQRAACDELSWPALSLQKLRSHRRSDTLYLLASGDSICGLEPQQWSEIRKSDSMGINFWLLHPHVPSYYCFETPRTDYHRNLLFQNLISRAKDYAHTKSIFKVSHDFFKIPEPRSDIVSMAAAFRASIPSYFTISNEVQLQTLMSSYERIIDPMRRHDDSALFRKRASILFCTVLGADLGFRNIVLCGVDGSAGSGYFYHSERREDLIECAMVPEKSGQVAGAVHKTMDKNSDPLDVRQALKIIETCRLQKEGVRIWLGTKGSALADDFPSWHWKDTVG